MAQQHGILQMIGAIQGRSSMAVQKGGRKRDGVAEDKETREMFSKKFVAAKVPQGLYPVCTQTGWQRWDFWMLTRYQSQFRSWIRDCDSYRHIHVSFADPLCFPLLLWIIKLILLKRFFSLLTSSPVIDPKEKTRI